MMINKTLIAHLEDLKNKCDVWHKAQASHFFSEEDLAELSQIYPASKHIIYDGGYEGARKKKIIFLYDEEDDYRDIVCLVSDIDQRFREINHRDILGALMSLQIDRGSFGDFWIENNKIYLYSSNDMAKFIIDNLKRINQLSVQFEISDINHIQEFKYKDIQIIVSNNRIDAIVAAITHLSRSKAKEMISSSLVQINHRVVEEAEELCHNYNIISIRGYGRFVYVGIQKENKRGRKSILLKQCI